MNHPASHFPAGFLGACALCLLLVAGCTSSAEREVIVYCALDEEFSRPVLEDFMQTSGIHVRPNFDVESTKTVQLYQRIVQQRNRPACDLFWNNEILHTLRLQQQGLLDVYFPPAATHLPDNYRDGEGQWYGIAARARVFAVNRDVVPRDQWPQSIEDLADEKWKGKVGIAKPLFGTTATHAAVLFWLWGDERARQFFDGLKRNCQVLSGNKQVAIAVGRGQLAFGLTDTDDAMIEQDHGMPVQIVFPDQQQGGMGTLFIPNTLCLIQGGPNPEAARQLMDYLLEADVEQRLAQGSSAQFPVSRRVTTKSRAQPASPIRWMEVDFGAAAAKWDVAAVYLRELFAAAE